MKDIARKILIDELIENSHVEKVEDVIFWALDKYQKDMKYTSGSVVAFSITQRILHAEKHKETTIQNTELINKIFKNEQNRKKTTRVKKPFRRNTN